MSRYVVETITREAVELVRLRDGETGASADVWVEFGNNCLTASLPAPDGHLVETVMGPARLQDLREQPSWYGIPLLFPWPSAIPDGRYEFGGREYQLPISGPANNAFHGFVRTRPWRVARSAAGDAAAVLVSTIDSGDHPEAEAGFPFPYRVEAEYRLSGGRLGLRFTVTNPGPGPLPFGYGAHPYFRLPLGSAGSRSECLLCVPAARKWDGQQVRAIRETGSPEAPPWDVLAPPVTGDQDLRRPRSIAERHYDGVYTELAPVDGMVECFVRDPVNRLEAVMRATPNHPNVVVYTPRQHSGVCFEPWTCPPNVFNLAARGVAQGGLIVLAPGEQWSGEMWLFLRADGQVSGAGGAGGAGEPVGRGGGVPAGGAVRGDN